MTSVQTRTASTSVSPPEPASRPLLDLVSRFQNRLEEGDRPGHRLISAGLAPLAHERAALEVRKQHLVDSLGPPASDEARAKLGKVVASLLGAFPTYGADREDARITVGLIVRALDDVPVWTVQRAAGLFLKNMQKTRWNPERAPTAPQIRAEAKLVMIDVEVELHRLEQVLSAEIVDSETTQDERKAAVAHWTQIKSEMARSNVIAQRTDDEIAQERAEQLRANEHIEHRDAWERQRAGLPPADSPFVPRPAPML
ncbi:UNVERIFIED_ORG: hypothetical protein J2W74_001919 [Methylorubrum zatmanii]